MKFKRFKRFLAVSAAAAMVFSSAMCVSATSLRDIFDAKYYASKYKDLQEAFDDDEEALWQHFIAYGLKEGRGMNEFIDIVAYREKYEDLQEAFGDDWDAYLNHFLACGAKEGRDNGTEFNALDYVERYQDLKEAFGDDLIAAWNHYKTEGKNENREARAETVVVAEKKAIEEARQEAERAEQEAEQEKVPVTTPVPSGANQPLPEWEAYDCKGATIRIAAEQMFYGTLEDAKENPNWVDSYNEKWEYLRALEEKYNCKFDMVAPQDGKEDILSAYNNGLGYADIFMKGPGVMLEIRDYLATVEKRDQLKMGSAFIDAASWNGVDYGFTYDNIGECFVLSYSRDYLKSIGMTKTPGDLFKEGKWSYEDAKAYFAEMKGKLPDGTYPIALSPVHYAYMAGGTNGVQGISSKGEINMDDGRYITALNFYKDLLDSGLAYPITGYTDNGDNTIKVADDAVMVYNPHDMAGYSGKNTHVIASVQNWQHLEPAKDNTDWGIVPYPWGSEVSVEGFDGNGLPILKNYFAARVDFTNVLVSGAKYRGEGSKDIPDWVLFQIVREYLDMFDTKSTAPAGMTPGKGSGQVWINSYTAEKNGQKAGNLNFSPDDMRVFTQKEDLQIWNWVASNVKVDYCGVLNGGDYVPFTRNGYFVIAVGKDAKASGEAFKAIGEANLKDKGLK